MWGNQNQANSAPQGEVVASPITLATGVTTFANTTVGAFINNVVVGTYGVPGANVEPETNNATSAGWITETVFTGPLLSLSVSNSGSGYSNTNSLNITSMGTAYLNAGTIVTNNTGGLVSVTLTSNVSVGTLSKFSYSFATSSANATPSVGTGATLTPVLGGRAGRVQYETIVAMSSITSNAGPTPL
jgi:hypothetical protein